eukprot:2920332-Prorocentrum_lima.AAC.1
MKSESPQGHGTRFQTQTEDPRERIEGCSVWSVIACKRSRRLAGISHKALPNKEHMDVQDQPQPTFLRTH